MGGGFTQKSVAQATRAIRPFRSVGRAKWAAGVQRSADLGTSVTLNGMRQSMSGTGNCFDNAPMESFWHSLKVEETHGQDFATRDQAKHCVFAYIEGWYNTTRMHSSLGYKSPTQFERDCVTESIKAANDSQSARLIKRAA